MEKIEKLTKLFNECIIELKDIGITLENKDIKIKVSNKAKKRYGCCKPEIPDNNYKSIEKKGNKYVVKYNNYKKYTIEISEWVLELKDTIIKNTIMHELIHCMPYCNNHGKKFKENANLINKKLKYSISRVGNKKEDFERSNLEYIEDINYKYKIVCTKCNNSFYRNRLPKYFIKKYRCGKCNGKFEIMQIR